MDLNPIAIKFLFEESLFYFNDDVFIQTNNQEYYGKNKSNIILLSSNKFLKDDFELLSKILAALKLSLDDVALLDNKAFLNMDFIKDLNPKKIILFGINPFEIGLKDIVSNTYEIVELDKIRLMQAERFSFYHTDASKKKALWFSLQKLLL